MSPLAKKGLCCCSRDSASQPIGCVPESNLQNIFLIIFFWCDLPRLAVFIIFVLFLPSSGPSYPSSFQVNPGIEHTSEDHGSDCESLTFTTRPGSFPQIYKTQFFFIFQFPLLSLSVCKNKNIVCPLKWPSLIAKNGKILLFYEEKSQVGLTPVSSILKLCHIYYFEVLRMNKANWEFTKQMGRKKSLYINYYR